MVAIRNTRKVDSCKKVKNRIKSWENRTIIEFETEKQVGLDKAEMTISMGSPKGHVRSTVGGLRDP